MAGSGAGHEGWRAGPSPPGGGGSSSLVTSRDKPPARGDLHAVIVPVRGDVAMRQLLGVGGDVGAPAEIDQAAIVMDELLHLGIHRLALVAVGLGAGLHQELVEALVVPERVV